MLSFKKYQQKKNELKYESKLNLEKVSFHHKLNAL